MGNKHKVRIRRRIVIKSSVEEFAVLGDFLRFFNGEFFSEMVFEPSVVSGQRRAGDLVIEVVPEVDGRKGVRLAGWFRIGSHRAAVVLQGATQEQLARFAEALRKEWFPTREEARERESARRRAKFAELMSRLPMEILREELSKHIRVDSVPIKTD